MNKKVFLYTLFFYQLVSFSFSQTGIYVSVDSSLNETHTTVFPIDFETYDITKHNIHGFNKNKTWVKIESNSSQEILFKNSTLSSVTQYILKDSNFIKLSSQGTAIQNNVKFPYPCFEIGKNTYLFRIETDNMAEFNLSLLQRGEKENILLKETVYLGLFFGGCLVSIVFLFIFFFPINKSIAILYSIHIFFNIVQLANMFGITYSLLPINGTPFGKYLLSSVAIVLFVTTLLLSLSYNKTKSYSKVLYYLHIFLILSIIPVHWFIFVETQMYFTLLNIIGLLTIILCTTSAVITLIKGNKLSKYYLIGTTFFLFTIGLHISANLNLLNPDFKIEYVIPFFIFLEIIVFNIGLSKVYNKKQQENNELNEKVELLKDTIDQLIPLNTSLTDSIKGNVDTINQHLDYKLSTHEITLLEYLFSYDELKYSKMTNKLSISKNTINTYIESIAQKVESFKYLM